MHAAVNRPLGTRMNDFELAARIMNDVAAPCRVWTTASALQYRRGSPAVHAPPSANLERERSHARAYQHHLSTIEPASEPLRTTKAQSRVQSAALRNPPRSFKSGTFTMLPKGPATGVAHGMCFPRPAVFLPMRLSASMLDRVIPRPRSIVRSLIQL